MTAGRAAAGAGDDFQRRHPPRAAWSPVEL